MPHHELVGHSAQRTQLENDITSGNIAHAYLLSGPRHIGKMTVARWFAEKLLSIDVPEENLERTQYQVQHLLHSDLLSMDQLWIEGVDENWDDIAKTSNVPQVHRSKKPAAKTDSISIDDVRALQERLYETGTGTYRCCIIRSLERMHDAAANAFLKILEEPPQGLVFILTTQRASSLLPTLISRTRTVQFRRLPRADMTKLVSDLSEDDRTFILHVAQGAPGVAIALKNDPDLLREHRQWHSQAQSFWDARSAGQKLSLLKPLTKRSEESDQLLLHLALTLREQGDRIQPETGEAFHQLVEALSSNAHRQLLCQQFVLR